MKRNWPFLLVVMFAFVVPQGGGLAEELRLSDVLATAVCKDDRGNPSPSLHPKAGLIALRDSQGRVRVVVKGKDCYLNPSEYTLAGSDKARCSNTRVGSNSGRYVGTRGLGEPHCER